LPAAVGDHRDVPGLGDRDQWARDVLPGRLRRPRCRLDRPGAPGDDPVDRPERADPDHGARKPEGVEGIGDSARVEGAQAVDELGNRSPSRTRWTSEGGAEKASRNPSAASARVVTRCAWTPSDRARPAKSMAGSPSG